MAMPEPESQPASHHRPYEGMSLRSFCIGLCLSALIGVAAPYSKHFLRSTYLASDFMPLGLVFPFLILVTLVNGALKAIGPSFGLRRSELALIFAMGLVATTIPTVGLTGTLLATITAPYYYASPENGWEELFQPVIPSWMAPVDEGSTAIRWLYEGLPMGQELPWGVWMMPLFWWLSLIAAAFAACTCLVVIFRKQWIEKERLPYPLVEVPILMTEDAERPGWIPPFMKTRMFWIGFSIPLFIVLWNTVRFFKPFWPEIPTQGDWIQIGRDFPAIPVRIYFPVLGFAYLINVQVAFSLWFFHLLSILQMGLMNRFGVAMGSPSPYSTYHAALGWQEFGGLVVMVGWGAWTAQEHLRQVWNKALGSAPEVDDGDEMMPYRAAVFGFLGGALYICCWLYASGMMPAAIAIFVPAVFIIYLGIARIVVEGGLVFARPPILAQSVTVYALGTTVRTTLPTMGSLAMSYSWFSDIKCAFITAAAHASRLADRGGVGRRAILWGIGGSVSVAIGVSVWYTIYMGYQIGAYNMDAWLFQSAGRIPFRWMASHLRNPVDTDTTRLMWLGIGAVAMGLLTFLRYRVPWWSLSPLGFPIANVQMIRNTALTIFLAWAMKVTVLKMGGNRLYHRALPLFFGLMLGYYTGLGIAWIADFVWFPDGQGHYLYGV